MATITVRQLDDETRASLQRMARLNGRSMEAEVRHILTQAAGRSTKPFTTLTARVREIAGTTLELPHDEVDARVDFSDPAFG